MKRLEAEAKQGSKVRTTGYILLLLIVVLAEAAYGPISSVVPPSLIHLSLIACVLLAWFFTSKRDQRLQQIISNQQLLQREKSALLELTSDPAIHSGDIQHALRRITEVSAHTLSVERVGVWIFDSNYKSISCLNSYSRSLNTHRQVGQLCYSDCTEYFDAILCNRVVSIDDTRSDPLTRNFLYVHEIGITSMLDAPFYVNGRLAGIVCHEHTSTKRIWTIDEQNFVASIGDMVSRSMQASEKLKVERELRIRSSAIEASIDGIAILDHKEKFVYVNQAHASMYGYDSPNELIGQDWKILYDGEQLERFENEHMPLFRQIGTLRVEAEGLRKDDVRFPQRISLTRMEGGGLICTCQDITQEKKLQSQLLQAHKMEAVGQLAGGIAHDFNNLLTGILGYAGLIKLRCKGDSEVYKTAELIENTSNKATQLTFKLLGFARKGKHQHIPVDLHLLINDTFLLLTRTIEKNIHISKSLESRLSAVMGDPVQIQQVLINLALNARDSMNRSLSNVDGGEIFISTKLRDIEENSSIQEIHLPAGRYIELSVRDTGCGIEPINKDRIFEPFFTTKPQGKGTGLGLAMVYGIVKNHGGSIHVESSLGAGSSFSILLPVIERPLSSQIEKINQPKQDQIISGTGHILLVDDHSVIRDAGSRMLTSLGYTVVTAKDGIEALSYLKDNAALVDLVILDMVMPRMGARECLKAMKNIRSDLKTVLSTGYVKNNLVQEILDQGVDGFVQKPFQLETLSISIAQILKPSLFVKNEEPMAQFESR